MDVDANLKELYDELDLLDQAIAALERAQAGSYRRRGRPPKWLQKARAEALVPKLAQSPNHPPEI